MSSQNKCLQTQYSRRRVKQNSKYWSQPDQPYHSKAIRYTIKQMCIQITPPPVITSALASTIEMKCSKTELDTDLDSGIHDVNVCHTSEAKPRDIRHCKSKKYGIKSQTYSHSPAKTYFDQDPILKFAKNNPILTATSSITILIEDNPFKANKNVICQHSEFFRQLLRDGDIRDVVEVEDVDWDAFIQIYKWMTTGEAIWASVSSSKLYRVLNGAIRLGLTELVKECKRALKKRRNSAEVITRSSLSSIATAGVVTRTVSHEICISPGTSFTNYCAAPCARQKSKHCRGDSVLRHSKRESSACKKKSPKRSRVRHSRVVSAACSQEDVSSTTFTAAYCHDGKEYRCSKQAIKKSKSKLLGTTRISSHEDYACRAKSFTCHDRPREPRPPLCSEDITTTSECRDETVPTCFQYVSQPRWSHRKVYHSEKRRTRKKLKCISPEDLMDMAFGDLYELLSSKEVRFECEKEILDKALNWLYHKWSERHIFADALLSVIRWTLLTNKQLLQFMLDERYAELLKRPNIEKRLLHALLYKMAVSENFSALVKHLYDKPRDVECE